MTRFLAMLWLLALGACGGEQPPGVIEGPARPRAVVQARQTAQASARAGIDEDRATQILFGDLHVHTTYSIDAFVFSLPVLGGEGAHPPADACDFARYCSSLDFFSINDHAEGLTPVRWQRTKELIRACNARAGDAADPDLVAFVGWEWTQVGSTPETHYGHKNVMFPDLDEGSLPARPITSLPPATLDRAPDRWLLRVPQAVVPKAYADFLWWTEQLADLPNCDPNVPTRDLPADCRENAVTPAALFRKLDEWGFETLVIPHGLSWGIHAPPGARLDNQLAPQQHDPAKQRLLEIYSGHGNAEEFRPFPQVASDGGCPAPTPDYLPCCWRAGELVRERCGDLSRDECEARVVQARQLALAAGTAPHMVLPDAPPEAWLDCDQCRDCFKPTHSLRPGVTAQYSLAVEHPATGDRFRWGFIASSDDHEGRPGTGYKQFDRRRMTDARGWASERVASWMRPVVVGRQADPQRAQPGGHGPRSFLGLLDVERTASFMYPGGLVAVHSAARDRRSIWDALVRRQVYGTSGPRILLWFDLVNAPAGRVPMGSEVEQGEVPRFEVRAVGAPRQLAGCPESSVHGLSPERLQRLCRGECDHPSDERHPIAAIEVVRVTPGPELAIEDPWLRFECAPDPQGCAVRFEDAEFTSGGRDRVYYVRALQEETPAINAANLRTEFDADGRARRVRPCYGDYRTSTDDDCLAPAGERAWSSPIYVDQPRPGPLPAGGVRVRGPRAR